MIHRLSTASLDSNGVLVNRFLLCIGFGGNCLEFHVCHAASTVRYMLVPKLTSWRRQSLASDNVYLSDTVRPTCGFELWLMPASSPGPQVLVFDLELQAPAASTQLPGSRPDFRSILACFGHASAGGAPLATGLDVMFCLHQVLLCLALDCLK